MIESSFGNLVIERFALAKAIWREVFAVHEAVLEGAAAAMERILADTAQKPRGHYHQAVNKSGTEDKLLGQCWQWYLDDAKRQSRFYLWAEPVEIPGQAKDSSWLGASVSIVAIAKHCSVDVLDWVPKQTLPAHAQTEQWLDERVIFSNIALQSADSAAISTTLEPTLREYLAFAVKVDRKCEESLRGE